MDILLVVPSGTLRDLMSKGIPPEAILPWFGQNPRWHRGGTLAGRLAPRHKTREHIVLCEG
jgi:hypothetical protein